VVSATLVSDEDESLPQAASNRVPAAMANRRRRVFALNDMVLPPKMLEKEEWVENGESPIERTALPSRTGKRT
jgi:hypothetical protein